MSNRAVPSLLVAAMFGAATMLAACGGGGADTPALSGTGGGGSVPSGATAPGSSHAALTVTQADLGDVRYPIISGTPHAAAINAGLLGRAKTLTGRGVACAVSTLRADSALVSFQWTCAGKGGLTATYDTASAQPLSLGDLFTAGYLDELSQTAIAQLVLGGASTAAAEKAAAPTPAAFSQWSVDDVSLMVTFTVSSKPITVSFPLASLAPILDKRGPLAS